MNINQIHQADILLAMKHKAEGKEWVLKQVVVDYPTAIYYQELYKEVLKELAIVEKALEDLLGAI